MRITYNAVQSMHILLLMVCTALQLPPPLSLQNPDNKHMPASPWPCSKHTQLQHSSTPNEGTSRLCHCPPPPRADDKRYLSLSSIGAVERANKKPHVGWSLFPCSIRLEQHGSFRPFGGRQREEKKERGKREVSHASSRPFIHPSSLSRGLPFSECCLPTSSVVRCDIRPPRWTRESQIAFSRLAAHETIPIHPLRTGVLEVEGLRRSRGGVACVLFGCE